MDTPSPATPVAPRAHFLARAARLAAGWSLLAVGGALLVLPGPGIPLVLAGLALLGREYHWARRLMERLRGHWDRVRDRALGRSGSQATGR